MQSSPPGRVCVVGSLNVDTTYTVATLPRAGETTLAAGRSSAQGGKGANQAIAAASQGSVVSFVAALGNDAAGAASLQHVRSRGVEVDGIQVLDSTSTGSAVVLVAEDGENLIVVDQAANAALNDDWVRDQVAAAQPQVVIAQLEVPISCVQAAAQASTARHFVLNPAPMPEDPTQLAPLLAHCDVLVPNRLELARLVGERQVTTLDDVDRCAGRLRFAGTLVVTLGADGAAVYGPGGTDRLAVVNPPPEVDVVDTTGAGDAFCGVLADRLARGFDVVAAAEHATRLAALSTTVRGAQVPDDFPAFDEEAVSG
jgi:ribokinase